MQIFPGNYCYFGMAILALVEIFWLYSAGHSLDVLSITGPGKAILLILTGVVFVRFGFGYEREGKRLLHDPDFVKWRPRLETLFEGWLFIITGWLFLRLLNHLTMTIEFPYADAMLAGADNFIRADWNAYFEFVANTPFLIWLLNHAYTGLTPLSLLAFVGLVMINQIEQARFFVITFTVTALVCTFTGMFFPAKGAVMHLLQDHSLRNNFPHDPGVYFVAPLEQLRLGETHVFNFYYLPGLTAFPSFHTAAGVVITYCYRRTLFFWLAAAYTAVMIAATPVYGGHYFVDLVAGAAVAFAVCSVFVQMKRFRGIFSRPVNPSGVLDQDTGGAETLLPAK